MKFIEATCKRTETYRKTCLVYVDVEGESILENLGNRFSRPVNLYKPAALAALEYTYGVPASSIKLAWSQKAGCRCGCSPGFIATGLPFTSRMIWLTFDASAPKVTEEGKGIAAARVAAVLRDPTIAPALMAASNSYKTEAYS